MRFKTEFLILTVTLSIVIRNSSNWFRVEGLLVLFFWFFFCFLCEEGYYNCTHWIKTGKITIYSTTNTLLSVSIQNLHLKLDYSGKSFARCDIWYSVFWCLLKFITKVCFQDTKRCKIRQNNAVFPLEHSNYKEWFALW